MKPTDAIKETLVKQGFSQPVKNYEERLINVGTKVRYLYEHGESDGSNTQVKEENDLQILFGQWMYIKLKIDMFKSINQCCTIYLDGGPKRSFVFEELQGWWKTAPRLTWSQKAQSL